MTNDMTGDFDLDIEVLPEDHRAGFVSIVGKPNVGKSTTINAYMGQKIAIVSPKPQTTRRRALGILTLDRAQLIFVDTPGIHKPFHKLGESMVNTAIEAIPDADVLVWLVDGSREPSGQDRAVARFIAKRAGQIPVLLGLNKSDLVEEADRAERLAAYLVLLEPSAHMFFFGERGREPRYLS